MTLTLGIKPGDIVRVLTGKRKGKVGTVRRKYFYADSYKAQTQYMVRFNGSGGSTYVAKYLEVVL